MILRPENARRRLDSLGRITLPKGLRDRMFMRDNEELEFFTFDLDGKMYIALSIADRWSRSKILSCKINS